MTHSMMVKLQAHLRGWLGRHMREKLELQHSAAHVIQRNVTQANIINSWAWWKMFQKVCDNINTTIHNTHGHIVYMYIYVPCTH